MKSYDLTKPEDVLRCRAAMIAVRPMDKAIPRIGAPPPEVAPVVMPRLSDSVLAGMTLDELRAHIRVVSDQVEEAMLYQEHVVDRIVIRRDLETDAPRLQAESSSSDLRS